MRSSHLRHPGGISSNVTVNDGSGGVMVKGLTSPSGVFLSRSAHSHILANFCTSTRSSDTYSQIILAVRCYRNAGSRYCFSVGHWMDSLQNPEQHIYLFITL
jgi:hypothetical protein